MPWIYAAFTIKFNDIHTMKQSMKIEDLRYKQMVIHAAFHTTLV